jgi:hypothetical protein
LTAAAIILGNESRVIINFPEGSCLNDVNKGEFVKKKKEKKKKKKIDNKIKQNSSNNEIPRRGLFLLLLCLTRYFAEGW